MAKKTKAKPKLRKLPNKVKKRKPMSQMDIQIMNTLTTIRLCDIYLYEPHKLSPYDGTT